MKALRVAYLITHDYASAEDVVQQAFVRVYERIELFDCDRPFSPWFLRMVVNDALKMAKRRARHLSLETIIEGEVPISMHADEDPIVMLEQAETSQMVWEALAQLSPTQRAVIVLRYYLQFSEDEMATQLERSPGTIKWQLHRARERLRGILRPWWKDRAT